MDPQPTGREFSATPFHVVVKIDAKKKPREGIDFYREGPFVVFTAHFLRERGFCCDSGCRHCPWKDAVDALSEIPTED